MIVKLEESVSVEQHQESLRVLLSAFDTVCKKHKISYILFAGTMLGAVRHKDFIPWDDDLDVLMLREDYDKFMKVAFDEIDSSKFYLQKEFTEHWPMFFSKLRLNNTACLEKYHPKDLKTHQGVYMDIFPCDNASNQKFIRKLQFLASKVVIAKSLYDRGYETDSQKKKVFMALCRLLPKKPFVWLAQMKKSKNTRYVHSFFGGSSSFEKSVYQREFIAETTLCEFGENQYPISAHYDELLSTLYGDYMRIPPESERGCKKHAILVDLNHSWEEYLHYRDEMVFDQFTRSIR